MIKPAFAHIGARGSAIGPTRRPTAEFEWQGFNRGAPEGQSTGADEEMAGARGIVAAVTLSLLVYGTALVVFLLV